MHLWQYNNEIIISQFCDTSGDTNKQLIDGQKIIDIRPHTRYNVSNLIRKQCYHYRIQSENGNTVFLLDYLHYNVCGVGCR